MRLYRLDVVRLHFGRVEHQNNKCSSDLGPRVAPFRLVPPSCCFIVIRHALVLYKTALLCNEYQLDICIPLWVFFARRHLNSWTVRWVNTTGCSCFSCTVTLQAPFCGKQDEWLCELFHLFTFLQNQLWKSGWTAGDDCHVTMQRSWTCTVRRTILFPGAAEWGQSSPGGTWLPRQPWTLRPHYNTMCAKIKCSYVSIRFISIA